MASIDGGIKIVGARGKHHHFRNSHTSRASVGFARGGTAAGDKLPTIFLTPGYRKEGLGDERLEELGCPAGSTVHPSENGMMTHAAWTELAPRIAKSIRALPVICDHPSWWFRLHVDGLSAHDLFEANKIFADSKILVVIEESHSSHVNQSYDKDPARASKEAMRQFIPDVRDHLGATVNHELDQWSLIRVIACLEPYVPPEAWVRGFKRVNLHPKYAVGIDVWLSLKSEYIIAAKNLRDTSKL